MVGTARFELTTSCSQSRRSTRLSYAPHDGGTLGESPARSKNYFVRFEISRASLTASIQNLILRSKTGVLTDR